MKGSPKQYMLTCLGVNHLVLNDKVSLKTTVHENCFLHPCIDYVCKNTPAKSHLQTPTRKHIKSQLNLTLGITNTQGDLKL